MKEHLKKYFPDRFPDSETGLFDKTHKMLNFVRLKGMNMNCEREVMSIVEESDEIRLLAGAMNKYGCHFDLARHVACEMCNQCFGGFDPDANQIVICQNNTASKDRILSVLMHEMIHMFDYCRAKFDFNNLEHVACSEVS